MAQPVIDSAWFATCKDLTEHLYLAQKGSQPVTLQELVGPAGEDVTWDFSDLQTIEFDGEVSYLEHPANLFGMNERPFNWITTANSRHELCFNLTAEKLDIVGYHFGDHYLFYDDPLQVARFPFSYFSYAKDTAVYTYDQDLIRSITYRTSICDAFGTLILPQDTFKNVLRVKFEDDTFHQQSSGGSLIGKMKQTTFYFWTTDKFAEPLTKSFWIRSKPLPASPFCMIRI